ncbi:MAG: hypothetical protein RIE58_12765 [Vicingaceae bacterium]
MTRRNFSLYLILFIGIFWTTRIQQLAKWKSQSVIAVSDTKYFYVYLPAAFIYHDLSLKFADSMPLNYKEKVIYRQMANGKRVSKALMGVSVMYAPFFFLGHFHTYFTDEPQNGYSVFYEMYLNMAGVFWALIGLYFLRKVLLRFYNEGIVALTLLLLAIGTNLHYYTMGESMMSHVYSFSTAAIFLWLSLLWRENMSFRNSAIMGLVGGLIVLIRPVNATVFILPMFFYLEKLQKVGGLNFKQFQPIIWMALFVIISLLPQLFYWKIYGGHFFIDTYGEEGFHFERTGNIVNGFFSFRKGWLLYTPLMALPLIGFFFFKRLDSGLNRALIVYFIITTYVIFSWYCWWYGGSFGSRAMIDTYAFLSLPLAATLHFLMSKKPILKIPSFLVFFLLVALNLFQTWQYYSGFFHFDGMTKESYWAIFLQTERPENLKELFSRPDYEANL